MTKRILVLPDVHGRLFWKEPVQKYIDVDYRELDSAWGTNGIKTAVETSDNPGEFSFAGIPEGYYKLVETKYPDGYIGARGNPLFRVVEGNGRFMLQLLEEKADGTIAPAENNRSDTVIVNDAEFPQFFCYLTAYGR